MIGLNKTLATFVGLARASVNEWPRAETQFLPANHYATLTNRIIVNNKVINDRKGKDDGCTASF